MKHRKSSRAANLHRRIRRIANGMSDARPNSPVHILKGKKIVKLSRIEYDRLTEQADSLSYFAGEEIQPEQLIK